MRRPAALLTLAAATGLLAARAVDGLGLLPGVHESEAVRRAATDPRWTALGLLGCLVLGVLAARLLRRSAVLAVGLLVGGQVALVVALEEVARELSGAPEEGGESGLVVAVAMQLLLAVLAVSTAVLVLALPHPDVGTPELEPPLSRLFPAYRVVLVGGPRSGPRGRSPPGGC
jgi:hypothetical protein